MKDRGPSPWVFKSQERKPKASVLRAALRGRLRSALVGRDEGLAIALLDQGADPNGMDKDRGLSFLVLAMACEDPGDLLLAKMIERGVDLNVPRAWGADIVPLLCGRDVEAFKMVVAAGFDWRAPGSRGMTTLGQVVHDDYPHITERMLSLGPSLDERFGAGITALMHAAICDCRDAASRLLAAGADPSLRDDAGLTAMDHAKRHPHPEMVKILEPVMLAIEERDAMSALPEAPRARRAPGL